MGQGRDVPVQVIGNIYQQQAGLNILYKISSLYSFLIGSNSRKLLA